MDQDEEEEDFAEEEEEEEEEEEDIYTKDKKKIFGDTSHYCPVMLKEKSVLWPGIAECAAKYRERTYFFSSPESRGTFLEDPESFLPNGKPLEVGFVLFCLLFSPSPPSTPMNIVKVPLGRKFHFPSFCIFV